MKEAKVLAAEVRKIVKAPYHVSLKVCRTLAFMLHSKLVLLAQARNYPLLPVVLTPSSPFMISSTMFPQTV